MGALLTLDVLDCKLSLLLLIYFMANFGHRDGMRNVISEATEVI